MESAKESLRDHSVLVTGASGFIGTQLVRALVERGARVHAVSLSSGPGSIPDVMWHQGDLASPSFVSELFDDSGAEVVYHLASHVSGSRTLEAVSRTLASNLVAAVNVLVESTRHGCRRIVVAGSMEEPDPTGAIPFPTSPYAAAKWAVSGYARMFHALYGTPVAVARIFMVYGPGQRDVQKLVPYVITSLNRDESPEVSSGVRPVDWIHVDDVVAGLLRLAGEGVPLGIPIDLGSGTLVTIRELVEAIEAMMGVPGRTRFGAKPDRRFEQVRRAAVASTSELIGWAPRVPLSDGLRQTIDWYVDRAEPGASQS